MAGIAAEGFCETLPALIVASPPADGNVSAIIPFSRRHLAWQRVFDLALAVVVIVCTAPLMIMIAVAVRVTSRGPALFRHERVGKDATTFRVLKFRTMRHGTHHDLRDNPEAHSTYVENHFKLPADSDRITFVGRVLRKTSLDELPQFLNVLRGHMSVVGIRPLIPAELLMRRHSDQLRYCLLRPGITGLWQVSGRSSVTGEARLALDRAYIDEWSLRRDVVILLRTPAAILRSGNAY